MHDRLQQALAEALRREEIVGVLFVDLDHFKNVNDSLGHQYGDELLQKVAQRLRSCMRKMDTLARYGGDEFVIVIPSLDGPGAIESIACKIIEACNQEFLLSGRKVHISASIGIALYPSDGADAASLIRNADLAMFSIKKQGRNRFRFYDNSLIRVTDLRRQ